MAKGVILVGGPCDGTKVVVPDNCTRKIVREETGPLSALSSMKQSRSNSITWREGLYEAGKDRQVFHWQGWIG